ncbi:hypothetical protein [Helicobacter sp. L8]|uniref:hypothetical protein n=1 Tax=Helicobacter sp. L8 TaxID=2316078 RepID=UPI0013CDE3B2|nr:hypothetical protein [Helicobacter sp. L8]
MKKIKAFCLGAVLVLVPVLTSWVCADVMTYFGPCHARLVCLSNVLLGALSLVPLVKIYQYTASSKIWALACKISICANIMIVVGLSLIGVLLDTQLFCC